MPDAVGSSATGGEEFFRDIADSYFGGVWVDGGDAVGARAEGTDATPLAYGVAVESLMWPEVAAIAVTELSALRCGTDKIAHYFTKCFCPFVSGKAGILTFR